MFLINRFYMMRLLLPLLIFATAWAQPAPEAPPLPPPATAKSAYQASQLVFVGKVLSVKKDKLGFQSQAQVQVVRTLKGQLARQVVVSGEGGPTHPARIFHTGETWLFYLGNDLHADSYANRVVAKDKIDAEIKALNRKVLDGSVGMPGKP